ncbi:hypothetical protein SAMN05421676_11517 [Salinibacillus kushneri]|uniref:Uncharacterized protein n=1 Tax=Salinibacillus kushneri TaxID=237682 RepID=A0A1I0J1L0_9BACI|nr:hypothetical protein SAMN05421676_11517 [Salinibacillus kushneri]
MKVQLIILSILFLFIFGLNILGLMNLIPRFITLPLLFISTYMLIYSLVFRRAFRGIRRKPLVKV